MYLLFFFYVIKPSFHRGCSYINVPSMMIVAAIVYKIDSDKDADTDTNTY